jgi:hypothetical protein
MDMITASNVTSILLHHFAAMGLELPSYITTNETRVISGINMFVSSETSEERDDMRDNWIAALSSQHSVGFDVADSRTLTVWLTTMSSSKANGADIIFIVNPSA